MDRKINLSTLNPYITCNICKGYLIDATAITECLHTFCKSCLIKHLEANTTCPTCNIVIHHSYPRQYINYDRTMQDIVYKLVPTLQDDEAKREKEFYRQRGIPCPKEVFGEETKDERVQEVEVEDADIEELISVCLECGVVKSPIQNQKIFIRVPTKTTISLLKKFIARKVFNQDQLVHLDIFCRCDILERHDTLKYVYLTKWKIDDPFVLQYRPRFNV